MDMSQDIFIWRSSESLIYSTKYKLETEKMMGVTLILRNITWPNYTMYTTFISSSFQALLLDLFFRSTWRMPWPSKVQHCSFERRGCPPCPNDNHHGETKRDEILFSHTHTFPSKESGMGSKYANGFRFEIGQPSLSSPSFSKQWFFLNSRVVNPHWIRLEEL